MAMSLVSFNAVRPVLFAGTLALAWLGFSASSGAADTGADSGSALGTVSAAASPLSSTASGAAGSVGSGLDTSLAAVAGSAVPAAPALRPQAPAPPQVSYPAPVSAPSQSVPENLAGPVAVPVVSSLDPAATVSTVIDASPVIDVVAAVVDDTAVPDAALQPVADLVTESAGPLGTVTPSPVVDVISPVVGVVSPVVDVVSPVVSPVVDMVSPVVSPVVDAVSPVVSPVVDAVSPVVSPVVGVVSPVVDGVTVPEAPREPVHDLVTDAAPLLIADFIPGAVDDHIVVVLSEVPAADTGAAAGRTGSWLTAPLGGLFPCGLLTGPLSMLLVPVAAASFAGPGSEAGAGAPRGSSGGPSPMPEPMLPPVTGLGSGQSSGGSQTLPAAWLSNIFEYLPLPGAGPVSGPLQHVPAPVSFDPGSSPD